MNDFTEGFRAFLLAEHGLSFTGELKEDGQFHGLRTDEDKPGAMPLRYCVNLDDPPNVFYLDNKRGFRGTWFPDSQETLDPAERERRRREWEANKAKREKEAAMRYADAAARALMLWEKATPAGRDHPYLVRKAVEPHVLRVLPAWTRRIYSDEGSGQYKTVTVRDVLLVPMLDDSRKLWNVQAIFPATCQELGRDKDFMWGGRKKGLFCAIGRETPILCVAEGYATAASVHEATGYRVFVAFDAGNLPDVATAVRQAHPDATVIICADHDKTDKAGRRAGQEKAQAAAALVGGAIALPPREGDDFNDWATALLQEGEELDAIREAVDAAAALVGLPPAEGDSDQPVATSGEDEAEPQATGQAIQAAAPPEPTAEASGEEAPEESLDFPDAASRPCWRVYLKHCGSSRKKPPGVWYHSLTKPDQDGIQHPVDDWVCGPLLIEATTRDKHGNSFGSMIRFQNKTGQWRQWNMPSRLLAGGGSGPDSLIGELYDLGLKIRHDKKNRVAAYISDQTPKREMWSATQLGWHGDAFVMPDRAIGADDVFFQSSNIVHPEFAQSGTAESWREAIGKPCQGNPLIVFHVATAFAGALLHLVDAEGIGFHIFGDSTRGKSTGAKLAASVWGNWRDYRRRWRASTTGLEGIAAKFNHGLLWLDEMNDGDPKEISEMLYALVDGTGKQRGKVDGSARKVATWTNALLSNGEKATETYLNRAGIQVQAGQLMRLLQIPMFGTHGCFDDLHGHANGAEFSEHLTAAALKHHGAAGVAYLERLVADLRRSRDFHGLLKQMVGVLEQPNPGLSPQERRALKSFAINALAGELATEYGLTGWEEGAAISAARHAFDHWRDYRGEGDGEGLQVLKRVREYLEKYGDARFTHVQDENRLHGERSGYWREAEPEGREWLFTSSGLQAACPGYESKQIKHALAEAGWLRKGGTRPQVRVKTYGNKDGEWFYAVRLPHIEDG